MEEKIIPRDRVFLFAPIQCRQLAKPRIARENNLTTRPITLPVSPFLEWPPTRCQNRTRLYTIQEPIKIGDRQLHAKDHAGESS
jgi:hypothetical protein